MCREAGVKRDRPLLNIDDQPVAVIYDPPHTIKNARNALFKYNAVFDGKIASFSHIRQLYNKDMEGALRLVPKLTQKSLFLPPFLSMNVALAVRVLSASTGGGIRYYVQTGDLTEECLHTAEFVEFHDKLFDVMNSKEKYADSVGKVCFLTICFILKRNIESFPSFFYSHSEHQFPKVQSIMTLCVPLFKS